MRQWLKGLAIGTCAGLSGAALILLPLGAALERNVGLSWLFQIRGPVAAPPEVAVVGINARTGADLGLPSLPIQWPRTIHGRLIDELARRDASVIVFDVHFAEPKIPAEDAAFAKAIADANRVVLLEKLNGRKQPMLDKQGKERGSLWVESVDPPMVALIAGSRGLGPFPLPKLGAAVYEFWTFKASTGDTPTLPAVALQLHVANRDPQWRESLAAISKADLDGLPPDTRGGAAELRYLMQGLRSALLRQADHREEATQEPAAPGPQTSAPVHSLISLYEKPSTRYLNFYGPPGSIATIPYQSVILGSKDPKMDAGIPDLKGKVVFVGYSDLYDPGQPDRFYTVFTGDDGVDLSGVEIAATSFANLLTDRALHPLDALPAAALLALFGLVLGALVYLLPAAWGVPIALTLAAAYAIGAQYGFNTRDLWLPLATPILVQAPVALFIGLFAQYFFERRRGQRVSEAISYYLPENVARGLAKNTLDPATVNKVVFSTCLATDMAGFSTIAEKLAPGELAAFLNEYFEGLSRPLREHGVDVTEFRADGIMCAWTSPAPLLAARRSAVLAALGAAAAITEFKERHPVLSSPLRIGLEAGWVYVGHAGGGGHFVYSIVGDCANTASRIESLNKHIGSQILASQDTVEGLEDILVRPLGRFQLMGKSEPVPVVEVMAVRAHATDRDLLRCERFGEALARFQCADWAMAHALLDRILNDHPEDGPARFYRARCLRYLEESAAAPEDPGLILMTEK